ncbi:glutamine--fructose-6-phosphate transaminase (isomerizing) [Candidatus Dojkabacteria bacterium]|uniref:Glutamine--fructose-6-phosphate aminotransferase [isomerizing] n=1 Tax=Candidatus Dojkabacteria bacterium TaxID=2099670 RepID=A0A952AI66_9BACT|nr:glutamine--fructose-6-phosphate transaminase (isomerizing) [Candidatus Dojkabacteria bacterium]
MCGIFGYAGSNSAGHLVVKGLQRLEYRGYDSWGIAISENNKIAFVKSLQPLAEAADIYNKEKFMPANTAIGHTRWATHGGVTNVNAHPHLSKSGEFALVHNGIVENYQTLKEELIAQGYDFVSETDTEVIVRLVEAELVHTKSLEQALVSAFLKLDGRNTIALLESKTYLILAIRNGSPLVLGKAADGYFLGSDSLSFADETNEVLILDDMQMVSITKNILKIHDIKTNKPVFKDFKKIESQNVLVDKDGYEHFMLKEISEQSHTIKIASNSEEILASGFEKVCKSASRIFTVGAGSAAYAAGQIAYYLRSYASLPAFELKAYEFESYAKQFTDQDLVIAVSQSGETADTIEAIEIAKQKNVTIASIVNMQGSTIPAISDYSFFTRSGPEICVVSTKAFSAQCAWGLALAKAVAGDIQGHKKEIHDVQNKLEQYLSGSINKNAQDLAKLLSKHEHVFVLGRGQNYFIALEGALKLKETTYTHAEGFAAGELKHGVIALIEKGTPVIVLISDDAYHNAMINAAAEIKSRGAYVIGIAASDNPLFDKHIPSVDLKHFSALANLIPIQLTAYYLALELGLPPDKPRNLAKSVTVK